MYLATSTAAHGISDMLCEAGSWCDTGSARTSLCSLFKASEGQLFGRHAASSVLLVSLVFLF